MDPNILSTLQNSLQTLAQQLQQAVPALVASGQSQASGSGEAAPPLPLRATPIQRLLFLVCMATSPFWGLLPSGYRRPTLVDEQPLRPICLHRSPWSPDRVVNPNKIVVLGQPTPSLAPPPTSPKSVIDIDPLTGEQFIKLDCQITLPTEIPNTGLHLVQFLYESCVAWLDQHDLRFLYTLPEDTTVVRLVGMIIADMSASARKWEFSSSSSSVSHHLRPHESLGLQLLGLVNKGIVRGHENGIFLRRQPSDSLQTLKDLLADKMLFAKPKVTIRGSRLIVRFVFAHSGITCLIDSEDGSLHRHSCLPSLYHSLFSLQNESIYDFQSPVDECESGGETNNDTDLEDEELQQALLESEAENLPSTPTPSTSTRLLQRAQNASSASASQRSRNAASAPTSQRSQHAPSAPTSQSLPLQPIIDGGLWTENWTAPAATYQGLFDMGDYTKSIFETASSGRSTELLIEGATIGELVDKLFAQIQIATRSGDFTKLLSADRTFQIVRNGSVISFGIGIKREVLYTALRKYTDSPGAWFLPRFDGKCSIVTTMSVGASQFISPERLDGLTGLGCIMSMLMIHGIAPEPLSPAFIQFIVNGCKLNSLTRGFIAEWHPDLVGQLDEWIAMGPEGDISRFQSFFATYHDVQAAAFRLRNLAQHQAIGREMLYHAIVGPQPPSHVELKAVCTGMQLPCSNGFDFFQVISSFPGGSTTYLSRTWTSVIHDYLSLKPHINLRLISPDVLSRIAGPTIPVAQLDLRTLLEGFLTGHGAPCPALLEQVKPHLSRLIPFDKIDSPAFRSTSLCWAVTGSPHIEAEAQLDISFVGPNDAGYDSVPSRRAAMMSQGKIAFRTCFQSARIPVSYIVWLCSQSYPAKDKEGNPTEPLDLPQAIGHWLLVEILGAIGDHSIY